MTALRVVSFVVGMLLAFGYFLAFTRSIRWLLDRGERKQVVFIVALAARQLILACVIALLWLLGMDIVAVLVGLCVGTLLSRLRIVRMFKLPER